MYDQQQNLKHLYDDQQDYLIDRSLKMKVLCSVSIAHVLLVVVPLVWFSMWNKFSIKKPMPMMVSLVNLNPDGKPDLPPGPLPVENKTVEPQKEPDRPDANETEEPDIPDTPMETPKPIVEPTPKVEPKIKPEPEKIKPVVNVPDKKVEPVKKWEPKKADEITISKNVVKAKKPAAKVSANDIAARFKKIQNQCKVTSPAGGGGLANGPGTPGGIGLPGATGMMPASYYDSVSIYLYEIWKQPGKAELRGLKPAVVVHVSIDANGMVKSAQITRKSGLQPMDSSIEELLAKVKNLPRPPQGAMELDISLEIDEQ